MSKIHVLLSQQNIFKYNDEATYMMYWSKYKKETKLVHRSWSYHESDSGSSQIVMIKANYLKTMLSYTHATSDCESFGHIPLWESSYSPQMVNILKSEDNLTNQLS